MLDRLLDWAGRTLEALSATLSMDNGYFWLLAGLVLIIMESLGGALALASLGVGAILTGVVAFLGLLDIYGLLVVFVLVSIALFAASRPLANRLTRPLRKGDGETNVDSLVGRTALVMQDIGGHHKPGYVKVGGEEWRAVPASDVALGTGATVYVVKVEGATLTVDTKPFDKEADE